MPAVPGVHEVIPLGEREGREGVQKGKSSQVNTLHTNTKYKIAPGMSLGRGAEVRPERPLDRVQVSLS